MQAALADGWADPRPADRAGPAQRGAAGRGPGGGRRGARRAAGRDDLRSHPARTRCSCGARHAWPAAGRAGRAWCTRRSSTRRCSQAADLAPGRWRRGRRGAGGRHGRVDRGRLRGRLPPEPGVAAAVLQAANHEVGTRQPVAEVAAGLAGRPTLVVDAGHELVYGRRPAGCGLHRRRRGSGAARPGSACWRPPRHPLATAVPGGRVGARPGAGRAERAGGGGRRRRAAGLPGRPGDAGRPAGAATSTSSATGCRSWCRTPWCSAHRAEQRLPHLRHVLHPVRRREALLTELDRRGFAVSSGSSCTSDTLTPSHVLVAMGALTSGNIRVSLHPEVEPGRRRPVPGRAGRGGGHASGPRCRPTAPTADPAADRSGAWTAAAGGARCRSWTWPGRCRACRWAPSSRCWPTTRPPPADIAAWCRLTGQHLVSSQPPGKPSGGPAASTGCGGCGDRCRGVRNSVAWPYEITEMDHRPHRHRRPAGLHAEAGQRRPGHGARVLPRLGLCRGVPGHGWQQINVTESRHGAVRGLHGEAMTKLVSCVAGEAFGVYLDARPDSPSYGAVVTVRLRPGVQVLVPAGRLQRVPVAVEPRAPSTCTASPRSGSRAWPASPTRRWTPAWASTGRCRSTPADPSQISAKDAGAPRVQRVRRAGSRRAPEPCAD